jgi:hypothetical protein
MHHCQTRYASALGWLLCLLIPIDYVLCVAGATERHMKLLSCTTATNSCIVNVIVTSRWLGCCTMGRGMVV